MENFVENFSCVVVEQFISDVAKEQYAKSKLLQWASDDYASILKELCIAWQREEIDDSSALGLSFLKVMKKAARERFDHDQRYSARTL